MAKKNFKSGMDLLLQGSKNHIEAEKKAEKDMGQSHHTKATYFFNSETLQSIKAIAYYERITIGEVIDLALKKHVQAYEHLNAAKEQYAQRYPDK